MLVYGMCSLECRLPTPATSILSEAQSLELTAELNPNMLDDYVQAMMACYKSSSFMQIGKILYDCEGGLGIIGQRCVAWAIDDDAVYIRFGRSFGLCEVERSVQVHLE